MALTESSALPLFASIEKRCSTCRTVKPVADFYFHRTSGTLRSQCKPCHYKSRRCGPSIPASRLAARRIALYKRINGPVATLAEMRAVLGEPTMCYLCGGDLTWADAELDHVVPLSRGGGSEVGNLAWAHRACNRIKGDRTQGELLYLIDRIRARLLATEIASFGGPA